MMVAAALLFAGLAVGIEWGKERPIAIVAGSQQEQPAIDGHIVAWSDNRSGNYDIFMYDLETDHGEMDMHRSILPAQSGRIR